MNLAIVADKTFVTPNATCPKDIENERGQRGHDRNDDEMVIGRSTAVSKRQIMKETESKRRMIQRKKGDH